MTGLETEPPLLFASWVRDGQAEKNSFDDIHSGSARRLNPAISGSDSSRRQEEARDRIVDRRTEEMNRNMRIPSVAAALFPSLGFLAGLLGANVGGVLAWFSRKEWL